MNLIAVLWNIFLAFASYFFCRVAYLWQNWEQISAGAADLNLWNAFAGSLLFDDAAICYTLGIYVLLMLLPLPVRGGRRYQSICKWYYMIATGLSIVANLADSLYFPYAGRRTTAATLLEFGNESLASLLKICWIEALRNWYLVVLAAAMIALIAVLYKRGCDSCKGTGRRKTIIIRCLETLLWLAMIPMMIFGMRGGFTRQTRPVNIGDAMRFVNTPEQAAAILNTPFAVIRNLSSSGYTVTEYMPREEVGRHFSAEHQACEGSWTGRPCPNVVIIIVESLSQEFMGSYNPYPGHTPFLDSLRSVSLSPHEAFANGNKSIDALPSIFASIPRLEEHLVLTPYVNSHFSSLVHELGHKGYSSAFFHGASPGSMGFDSFAGAVGIERTYSYADYCKDRRFGGSDDFDGHWAIWDEEFLQYTALHAEDMKEPFLLSVFTASSHHPFIIPEKHRDRFTAPGNPMYNCVRYTDYSLRRFFETASAQPWYGNTIFIITADHSSSQSEQESYLSDDLGNYRIPIIIFDPSHTLPRGIIPTISQQTDIFPTLMGILGTDRAYVAFGKDMLEQDSTPRAYIYNEIHTLVSPDGHFSFDGEKVTAGSAGEADLKFLQALIQDYKSRVIEGRLKIF